VPDRRDRIRSSSNRRVGPSIHSAFSNKHTVSIKAAIAGFKQPPAARSCTRLSRAIKTIRLFPLYRFPA